MIDLPKFAVIDLPKFALSIRQPWAYCIINLGKDIENRDWYTKFRGPVCIHAAKGMTRGEYDGCLSTVHAIGRAHPFVRDSRFPALKELDRGGIIGMAVIETCVESSTSPWFFGRYGFVLRNVKPVDFIPVKGALGFFDWRKNLEENNSVIKAPAI